MTECATERIARIPFGKFFVGGRRDAGLSRSLEFRHAALRDAVHRSVPGLFASTARAATLSP